jgi:hypothetical protein
VGLGLPVVAVPFPNFALAQHPAFRRGMTELEALGVRLVFDPDAYPLPRPNLGPASRDLFPWQALREELAKLTDQLAPWRPEPISRRDGGVGSSSVTLSGREPATLARDRRHSGPVTGVGGPDMRQGARR